MALNTAWLGGTVALDDDGFSLTGSQADAEGILETSMPCVFAVGRAMVVHFVHERFSGDLVEAAPVGGSWHRLQVFRS